MIGLRDIGKKITCPKCGKEGMVRVVRNRKKGREYWYLVVRHYDENKYCIIRRIDVERIETIEDVVRLVGELEELRKRVKTLETENEGLKKELMKLRVENSMLKGKVEFYEDIWRKSIIVRKTEKVEDKIDEIKNLLKQYDGIRILPFKYKVEIQYGLEDK